MTELTWINRKIFEHNSAHALTTPKHRIRLTVERRMYWTEGPLANTK
jgi:hypothetical protein